MDCNTEELRLDARKEEDLLSCPPPFHWVPGDVTRGKVARLEGDASLPCGVEVKKEWRYIQGVTGGTDQTSGECSLGQTILI